MQLCGYSLLERPPDVEERMTYGSTIAVDKPEDVGPA
jgi:hypothetical protein